MAQEQLNDLYAAAARARENKDDRGFAAIMAEINRIKGILDGSDRREKEKATATSTVGDKMDAFEKQKKHGNVAIAGVAGQPASTPGELQKAFGGERLMFRPDTLRKMWDEQKGRSR
jgi:hypothetical protein